MGTEIAVDPYHTDVFSDWIIDLGNFPTEQKHSFLFRKGLRVIGQPLLSTNNNILIPHGPVIIYTYTYNNLVGRLRMRKSLTRMTLLYFPPIMGIILNMVEFTFAMSLF